MAYDVSAAALDGFLEDLPGIGTVTVDRRPLLGSLIGFGRATFGEANLELVSGPDGVSSPPDARALLAAGDSIRVGGLPAGHRHGSAALLGKTLLGTVRLTAGASILELESVNRGDLYDGQQIEISGESFTVTRTGAAVVELRVFSAAANVTATSGATGEYRLKYFPPASSQGVQTAARFSRCVPVASSAAEMESALSALVGTPVTVALQQEPGAGTAGVGLVYRVTFAGSYDAVSTRNSFNGVPFMFAVDSGNAGQASATVCDPVVFPNSTSTL